MLDDFSYYVLFIYSCIEHGCMNTTEHSSSQRTALRSQLSFTMWQVSRSGHQAWWQGPHSVSHLVYSQVENCLSNCNPNQLNATFSLPKKQKQNKKNRDLKKIKIKKLTGYKGQILPTVFFCSP